MTDRRQAATTVLDALPAAVRAAIRDDPCLPEAGAETVLAAFWTAWRAESGCRSGPSEAVFRHVATSESRLACLQRSLARYAPDVPTYASKPVRSEFYVKRSAKQPNLAEDGSPSPTDTDTPIHAGAKAWPEAWQRYLPALAARRNLRPSSLQRYCRSIDRCAAIVREQAIAADFGFSLANSIASALKDASVRPITRANYIDALIQLGSAGGIKHEHLDAMRYVAECERETADAESKLKDPRIIAFTETGGYERVGEVVGALRAQLDAVPQHSQAAHGLRQKIALLLLMMNKPARTGDLSKFRFGFELIRTEGGDWHLSWQQTKTSHATSAGILWAETAMAMDMLMLSGRPAHLAQHRYLQLNGCNWLTLSSGSLSPKWPSEQIKAVTGIPAHDFRTLAADLLRRHDPKKAPDILSAHLGHKTGGTVQAYRVEADGETATEAWQIARRAFPTTHKGEMRN